MSASTRNHKGSAAEVCRVRGWIAGTRLIGDEGYGPTVIEVTAIGERGLLAKRLGHAGAACKPYETSWVRYCRDWREAKADEVPVPLAVGERALIPDRNLTGVVLGGPDSAGSYRVDCGADGVWIARAISVPSEPQEEPQ